MPPAARASALKGEAHDPYGAVMDAAAEFAVIAAHRPNTRPPTAAASANVDRMMLLMCGSRGAHRMLGCSDAGHSYFLFPGICACRGRDLGLCAGVDFQTVCAADDLGGVPRVPVVSFECTSTAPLQAQILERRRADHAGAHRHPAAVERAVGRVRVADIRIAQADSAIRDQYGHQVVFGFAAISMDRPNQFLAADTRRYLRRTTAILAGGRHARSDAAGGELGRLVPPGRARLAAGLCNHVVSAVLFSARWG